MVKFKLTHPYINWMINLVFGFSANFYLLIYVVSSKYTNDH